MRQLLQGQRAPWGEKHGCREPKLISLYRSFLLCTVTECLSHCVQSCRARDQSCQINLLAWGRGNSSAEFLCTCICSSGESHWLMVQTVPLNFNLLSSRIIDSLFIPYEQEQPEVHLLHCSSSCTHPDTAPALK